jgi:hypothetical protein
MCHYWRKYGIDGSNIYDIMEVRKLMFLDISFCLCI